MRSARTERRGFPGGLRAQLLLGLCFVITLGVLLGAGLTFIPNLRELPAAHGRVLIITYIGLALLVLLLLGYAFFTYLVMRPIRAIGVATQRAAQGDLASPIAHLPHNEFGQVSRQFNQMLTELARNREKLEERLHQLDHANRELKDAQDSLIRSEKLASVGQLAAGIAHEIGNPLAALSGYLEIMDDLDLDDDTRHDILQRGQREVDRIRIIVRNLLDFSREDSTTMPGSVDLGGCIDEAIQLVKAQPKAHHVAIESDIPADLGAVHAVASEVVQILVNLLINAVDALATRAENIHPRISLSAQATAGQVRLAVQDNGPGIATSARQRIFDPFFTTKDPGQGTGLGLAICLRLMRRVDGDIEVESYPGDGTTFTLIFRCAPRPEHTATP